MNRKMPSAALAFFIIGLLSFLALTNCATSARPKEEASDAEFATAMSTGRAAFDQGLIEQAATLYQRALERARLMDSAREIGDAAYNLAACHIRLGQYEKARSYLAVAKSEVLIIQGDVTDILLVEAKVARLQNRPAEALAFTDQILSGAESSSTKSYRLQAHLLRGQIACDKEDTAFAVRELQMAEKLAAGISDIVLRAALSHLAGRIYLIQKEPVKAGMEFDRQASLLRQAEQYDQMARALQSAAEAYLQAGKNRLAADRFFRAARSSYAQGQNAAALKLGNLSLSAADNAGDQRIAARARALLDEIETAAGRK